MRQINISSSITSREMRSLDAYLHELRKTETIPAEEEVRLAQLIRMGDPAALEELTKSNLRFVVSVAKKYQNRGLPLGDLISEGNLGLLQAAKRFDETRGFKFISYAVWWIRQNILVAIAEQSRLIRLPANHIANMSKVNHAISSLEQTQGRSPTSDEVALLMEAPKRHIAEVLHYTPRTTSLDSPFRPFDDDFSLLDTISSGSMQADEPLFLETQQSNIKRVLDTLSPRERRVIQLSFGLLGNDIQTLPDIGALLGLSTERTRQIKKNALAKLGRNPVIKELLRN